MNKRGFIAKLVFILILLVGMSSFVIASNCTDAGYKCTSEVRGCGLDYQQKDFDCEAGVGVICCEEVSYCGDEICDTEITYPYPENWTNCPEDCGVAVSACIEAGHKCTSQVRGCGHYEQKDLSCNAGVGVICCTEIPYCGDGVCFEHDTPGYGENETNCPADCGGEVSCLKYYTCPDGTEVIECEIEGTGCICNQNPASLCPEEEEEIEGGIVIKGRLVDGITEEHIDGARLRSAYEFFPSEVVSDSDGNFEFTIKTDFIIKEGPEANKSDIGGSYAFSKLCYDYAQMAFQKNYEIWEAGQLKEKYDLASREMVFDGEERVEDISGQSEVDIGGLMMYPMAHISIKSDKELRFTIMYKYKNLHEYNGAGNSNYRTRHYLSNALPLDYDVFIEFKDEQGNEYYSNTYHVPIDARCGIVNLEYFNGASEWSTISKIEPDEETGPIEMPGIPEEIEENEEMASGICSGCLKNKKCYPFGYRKAGKYCLDNYEFVEQLEAGKQCDNNFECKSNVCVDGECISAGLLRRILNWFKRLFG